MDGALIQDLTVQALNISLMLSVGLDLDLAEVRATLRRAGLLLGVVGLNFGLLPALSFTAVWLLPLAPAVAAGLLLCAYAPGGGTGTLLTRAARGNLELSVVLLGALTLLAVVLTPALTLVSTPTPEGTTLALGPLLSTLVLFQLLPLLFGVGVRVLGPTAADRLGSIARPVSNAIFAALVVGLLVTRGHLVPSVGWTALVTIAGLVLASLVLPAWLPGTRRDRSAVTLTTGVRNLSLALLLSSTFFDDLTTLTVLVYGLVMYLIAVPWALLQRRRGRVPTTIDERSPTA